MTQLHEAVMKINRDGGLAVQPRMGFGTIAQMQEGLQAVQTLPDTIGTITVDAYTRVGQLENVAEVLRNGGPLNGYPIVTHGAAATRQMVGSLKDADFPVQVRHGSAFPQHVFEAAAQSGLSAIEGGPVSYNLPYSRVPLGETIDAWAQASKFWAEQSQNTGQDAHIETFGGCMLGQLCPPDLLVALSALEAMFFSQNGVSSVSLSLAQGPSQSQDIGALIALRRLAETYLPQTPFHLVFYSYMGLFPQSVEGSQELIRESARVAKAGGAERLIVKTAAESRGIPTIQDNLDAHNWCHEAAQKVEMDPSSDALDWADTIESQASRVIEAVRSLSPDIGLGMGAAFANGIIDIPYCIHPDNKGVSHTAIDPSDGSLTWVNTGDMPLQNSRMNPDNLIDLIPMLEFMRNRYDQDVEPETQEDSQNET